MFRLSPKFLYALIVDMVLIVLTLTAYGYLAHTDLLQFALPLVLIYAVLHTVFEHFGIG